MLDLCQETGFEEAWPWSTFDDNTKGECAKKWVRKKRQSRADRIAKVHMFLVPMKLFRTLRSQFSLLAGHLLPN